MKGRWLYIVPNQPNGTLYIGVTSDIARWSWEHRSGAITGFTRRYGFKRLVYAEFHEEIGFAIQREKALKHWPRAWKVNLILAANPEWEDLYNTLIWPALYFFSRHARNKSTAVRFKMSGLVARC